MRNTMSATTHHYHHDLIERKMRDYNPETIADLEAAIEQKIKTGQELANQLFHIHRRRIAGIYLDPPAWAIRQQLDLIQEELELDFAILDRRRI